MNDIQQNNLWKLVIENTTVSQHSIHGPIHWLRVERNGSYLSRFTGADDIIVQLFAIFHDCMRLNDGIDDGHGQRGAEYAIQLWDAYIALERESLDLLVEACSGHTDVLYHDDITIATCWDADRLDLVRIGTIPDPKFLNTSVAKQIAQTDRFDCLEQIPLRIIE